MAYQCSAITVQNTHLEIPTDIHALESLGGAQIQHLLPTPALATHIFSDPPNSIKCSAIFQREETQSPVSPEQDTEHFCCHCATLHRRHHLQWAPPASQLLLLCRFGKRRVSPWLLLTGGQTSFPFHLTHLPPGSPADRRNHSSNQEKLWS